MTEAIWARPWIKGSVEHSVERKRDSFNASKGGRLSGRPHALLTGDEEKGTKGGEKARFKPKEYLINGLIAKRCLTGIAAFNKVGKTKLATDWWLP